MFYLYEHRKLKALKMSPQEAIKEAQSADTLLLSNSIRELITITTYPKSAFLLHTKNKYTLFSFWKEQIKYRTAQEFRYIVYASSHDFLYSLLRIVAWCSFGYYHLLDFNPKKELS